jgi:glycosyltransferase involved in cell wall biosynthesis
MPRLSVVIAARNEEKAIRGCLESLVAQHYADLQIIAVNDRSTDSTGDIMTEIAGNSAGRLQVIEITEVPDGWLGKCNAMSVGAAAATGEFILFTDGDVLFEPSSLQRAVGFLLAENADMLAVFPDFLTATAGERIMVLAFGQVFAGAYSPWKAADDRSSGFIGVGAFNMVRRSLYRQVGGHRFLRLQVIDDVGLGKIVKHAGGRVRVALGRGMVHIRWQDSLAGTIRGLEKNAFAAMGYNPWRTVAAIFGLLLIWFWPWAGMFVGPLPARFLCGFIALGIQPLVGVAITMISRSPVWMAFFGPYGVALLAFAVMRSMVLTLARGGVRWRDSFYPLSVLRQFRL